MKVIGQDKNGINLFRGDVIGTRLHGNGSVLPKYIITGSTPEGLLTVKDFVKKTSTINTVNPTKYELSFKHSPEHSNYERWFGHIGTMLLVNKMWYEDSADPDSREFWLDLVDSLGAVDFLSWLKSPYDGKVIG